MARRGRGYSSSGEAHFTGKSCGGAAVVRKWRSKTDVAEQTFLVGDVNNQLRKRHAISLFSLLHSHHLHTVPQEYHIVILNLLNDMVVSTSSPFFRKILDML